jgi:hypothetical protein
MSNQIGASECVRPGVVCDKDGNVLYKSTNYPPPPRPPPSFNPPPPVDTSNCYPDITGQYYCPDSPYPPSWYPTIPDQRRREHFKHESQKDRFHVLLILVLLVLFGLFLYTLGK